MKTRLRRLREAWSRRRTDRWLRRQAPRPTDGEGLEAARSGTWRRPTWR